MFAINQIMCYSAAIQYFHENRFSCLFGKISFSFENNQLKHDVLGFLSGVTSASHFILKDTTFDFRRPEDLPVLIDNITFVNNDDEAWDALLDKLSE